MKNKKNVKAAEPTFLAKGIYKKRVWPWIFIIAAILAVAAFIAVVAIEFSNGPKCIDHKCSELINYLYHYNIPLMIACIAAVVVILCALFSFRKRSLTVSATAITFKKGRKTIEIPLTSIKSIDTGASSIIVTVPFVMFKLSQLKNKKEIYDVLLTQMNAPAATTVTSPQNLTAMATPLLTNPTLQGKLAYFKNLRDANLISAEQYDNYVAQSFKADSEN